MGGGGGLEDGLRGVADSVVNAVESGARLTEFWARSGQIYAGFKLVQLETALYRGGEQAKEERWAKHHDWAARKMYELCVDMRGFFLKAGQFLGMRDDFFPRQYVQLLSTLQDRVPPMTAAQTRRAIEAELGGAQLESVFTDLELDSPLGSGTIAQVHSARRALDGRKIALKIQYPGAQEKMVKDLARLRVLAKFLQKTELKFDMMSAIDELSGEIHKEFNFSHEAAALDRISSNLQRRRVRHVEVPQALSDYTTPRMLVMTFLEGTPMTQLKDKMTNVSERKRRFASRRLLERITDAYGGMILLDGVFQADPHPGNIMVKKDLSIGIVDFGQWKIIGPEDRRGLAKLFTSMHRRDSMGTIAAMNDLGIRMQRVRQDTSMGPAAAHAIGLPGHDSDRKLMPEEKIVHTMFDTRKVSGASNSPFSKDSAIKEVSVESFPKQLYFVLRTVQILRGVAHGMNQQDFSLCDRWSKNAVEVLRS